MAFLMHSRILSWLRRRHWRRTAAFWGKRHDRGGEDAAFWLADARVMQWVNRKVSGQPGIWPLSWFLLGLPEGQTPVRHAVSIGCGPGNLEREVLRHQVAVHVTGVDISPVSLEMARRLAHEAGYASRITYVLSDAETWLRGRPGLQGSVADLIFFHSSLHHVASLETVLGLCAEKLRHGEPGLLYLDEYIGPSRDEWQLGHLGYAASLYDRVPMELRRFRTLRPPVAYQDPTEMIRSSEIMEVVRDHFEVLKYKPYFGNVVMPLISGIRPSGLEDPRLNDLLMQAMQLEDYLVGQGLLEPMHAVIVGRPLGSGAC